MEIKTKPKISFNVGDAQVLSFSEKKESTPSFSATGLTSLQNGYSPYINEEGYWMYYDSVYGWKNSGTRAQGQDYVLTVEDKKEIAEQISVEALKLDDNLIIKDGALSVKTASSAEQDNTLPITSAAVFATVGNIEILLQTI